MKVKIPPRKKNIPAFLCVLKYDRNRATNNIQKEPARKGGSESEWNGDKWSNVCSDRELTPQW